MPTFLAIDIIATLLVVLAVIYIGSRPERFRIERSALVNAPAEVIFPLINDLHQWARWSPYEKLGPNMKRTFEGPSAGPGASSSWEGNSKAGAGRMTITESKPGEQVSLRLEFSRPFKAINQANLILSPTVAGT